jgi:hypothetical protein
MCWSIAPAPGRAGPPGRRQRRRADPHSPPQVKKTARLRGKAAKAARQPGSDAAPAPTAPGSVPGHLKRKVVRKLRFLERAAASAPPLAPRTGSSARKRTAKRARAAGGSALGDLGALAAALGDAEAAALLKQGRFGASLGPKLARGTARSRAGAADAASLRAALADPAFAADPVAAVAASLAAAAPPRPPTPPPEGGGDGRAAQQRIRRRREARAAARGRRSGAMEA